MGSSPRTAEGCSTRPARILAGERPELGRQGRAAWQAQHRWEDIVPRYEAAFAEVLETSAPAAADALPLPTASREAETRSVARRELARRARRTVPH